MMAESFNTIAAQVKGRSGIVLTPDKAYMLETRLAPLMQREGMVGCDVLASRLRVPGSELLLREVVDALTTNESSFFRDGKPFDHLGRILPELGAANRPVLRIWSAACSTGQEAYSVAMLLAESGKRLGGRRAEIVGTDICAGVVARAREGLYTQFEVQRGLPVQMLVRHFTKEGAMWRIAPELRAAARFEVANLLQEIRHLGKFDAIFCRNVLIYFDTATKQQVLRSLSAQLQPKGVLYLGGAETLLGLDVALVPMPNERGVYRAAG